MAQVRCFLRWRLGDFAVPAAIGWPGGCGSEQFQEFMGPVALDIVGFLMNEVDIMIGVDASAFKIPSNTSSPHAPSIRSEQTTTPYSR